MAYQIDDLVFAVLLHQRLELVGDERQPPQIVGVRLRNNFAVLLRIVNVKRKDGGLGDGEQPG